MNFLVALGPGNEADRMFRKQGEQLVGRKPTIHYENEPKLWSKSLKGDEQFIERVQKRRYERRFTLVHLRPYRDSSALTIGYCQYGNTERAELGMVERAVPIPRSGRKRFLY